MQPNTNSLISSRTRREPNPNPVALNEQDTARLNQHRENSFKPEFIDCSKLEPVVEEQAERGKSRCFLVIYDLCVNVVSKKKICCFSLRIKCSGNGALFCNQS